MAYGWTREGCSGERLAGQVKGGLGTRVRGVACVRLCCDVYTFVLLS